MASLSRCRGISRPGSVSAAAPAAHHSLSPCPLCPAHCAPAWCLLCLPPCPLSPCSVPTASASCPPQPYPIPTMPMPLCPHYLALCPLCPPLPSTSLPHAHVPVLCPALCPVLVPSHCGSPVSPNPSLCLRICRHTWLPVPRGPAQRGLWQTGGHLGMW